MLTLVKTYLQTLFAIDMTSRSIAVVLDIYSLWIPRFLKDLDMSYLNNTFMQRHCL